MVRLVGLKCVIASQLSKMGPEYITKLVFNPEHECGVLLQNNRVIGGCVFCRFRKCKVCELVFLAVDSAYQWKGNGSKIITHFKDKLATEGFKVALTCADNEAILFFKKQGFSFTLISPSFFQRSSSNTISMAL